MGLNQTSDVRIVHYEDERIGDPFGDVKGALPWQEYQSMRNDILTECRLHGSVGSLGPCKIDWSAEQPSVNFWDNGVDDPDFFVVDDQFNDERYIYVNVLRPERATLAWIRGIVGRLGTSVNWGVCVTNIRGGYFIVFANFLLVTGKPFRQCHTVDERLTSALSHF